LDFVAAILFLSIMILRDEWDVAIIDCAREESPLLVNIAQAGTLFPKPGSISAERQQGPPKGLNSLGEANNLGGVKISRQGFAPSGCRAQYLRGRVTVCSGFFNLGHEKHAVARRKPEIITSNYF
jgi:hypothetical protein